VALFREGAPEVALNLHVGSLNLIERGVMDGRFQPSASSPSTAAPTACAYDELFGETMLLYCGAAHPLFGAGAAPLDWDSAAQPRLRRPGLPLAQHGPRAPPAPAPRRHRLRPGIGGHADSVSGRFLGFLPDHYAEAFVRAGRMRAVQPELFHYACRFSAITRRSPAPSRATELLRHCLVKTHGDECGPVFVEKWLDPSAGRS
jgi:DNA-binding transcriptional LysR family regulator